MLKSWKHVYPRMLITDGKNVSVHTVLASQNGFKAGNIGIQ